MRIIELPFEFCSGHELPIAVLIHRPDALAVRHDIYLGDNYTFSGEVTPASYQLLASHNRFAQHGSVVVDYPANTLTIDHQLGLFITLDGTDRNLDEQSAFNALADEFLVFVGDEILSVISVDLVAANTYRLEVIRGRLATSPSAHFAGAEVYLVARRDLLPLTHRSFEVGNEVNLKVVTASRRAAQDLADVDAITHEISGQILLQTAPQNLRVNRNLRNATYTGGTDLRLDWSVHELRGLVASQFGLKIRTQLQLISLIDEDVLYSKLTYASSVKILAARMATILGAETGFKVSIRSDILGANLRLQTTAQELTVLPP